LACMGIVLGITALTCGSSASAEEVASISEQPAWSAPDYRTNEAAGLQTRPSEVQRRPHETPTAPLPRALWPGLMILLALGVVRIAVATRKMARR
jgi:hypothetical protein